LLSLARLQNLALAAPAAHGYAGVNPGPVMNEGRPMARRRRIGELVSVDAGGYGGLVRSISELLDEARRSVARAANSILAPTYWEVGRRIVEFEQGGKARAEYGDELLKRLSQDLRGRHGRGFSRQGLQKMRAFYQGWEICPTASGKLEAQVRRGETSPAALEVICPTASGKTEVQQTPPAEFLSVAMFPLSWSHYVRLMAVEKAHARLFYESEAIRGGWSVRQLDRQIGTQFFERTAHSKQQAAMLARGQKPRPEDAVSVKDEVRDPYLLEFLDLKDEYSETELEEALIRHLESFLLELGAGFTFVARQKRIRIGHVWYRIDLLLYHRGLRCLVVIDLKCGDFTHADAGQMNLYLNYVKEHLTMPDEAEPVGIILCSGKDDAVVEYAMGGINARVFASKYLTQLPDEDTLRREIEATKRALTLRSNRSGKSK
jgi:predicted nuclease of restriction endonuclease-like (RecB) superfamily